MLTVSASLSLIVTVGATLSATVNWLAVGSLKLVPATFRRSINTLLARALVLLAEA
jgi:hypothetical protein